MVAAAVPASVAPSVVWTSGKCSHSGWPTSGVESVECFAETVFVVAEVMVAGSSASDPCWTFGTRTVV